MLGKTWGVKVSVRKSGRERAAKLVEPIVVGCFSGYRPLGQMWLCGCVIAIFLRVEMWLGYSFAQHLIFPIFSNYTTTYVLR